jgi:hypothetical protein
MSWLSKISDNWRQQTDDLTLDAVQNLASTSYITLINYPFQINTTLGDTLAFAVPFLRAVQMTKDSLSQLPLITYSGSRSREVHL